MRSLLAAAATLALSTGALISAADAQTSTQPQSRPISQASVTAPQLQKGTANCHMVWANADKTICMVEEQAKIDRENMAAAGGAPISAAPQTR